MRFFSLPHFSSPFFHSASPLFFSTFFMSGNFDLRINASYRASINFMSLISNQRVEAECIFVFYDRATNRNPYKFELILFLQKRNYHNFLYSHFWCHLRPLNHLYSLIRGFPNTRRPPPTDYSSLYHRLISFMGSISKGSRLYRKY